MSDCETHEDKWEEEINMNTCDRCHERMFPSETYCTEGNWQICKECMKIEHEDFDE